MYVVSRPEWDIVVLVLLVLLAVQQLTVFATSNNIIKMPAPLQSRFFIVELEPYSYEQFRGIAVTLLSRHRVERGVANVTANAVWNKSQDKRDCIKIGAMAKTISDVEFIVDKFFGPKTR